MKSGVKGESGISVCHGWTLFSDSLGVLGQRWVWLPVWLCAAVRRPQLCLSVGPSGKRALPGSGAAHMAGHTPGSCRQPEPAITHTMQGVCATTCILWGKLTFQLFHC